MFKALINEVRKRQKCEKDLIAGGMSKEDAGKQIDNERRKEFVAAKDATQIDENILFNYLNSIDAKCPVCRTPSKEWKAHPKFLDFQRAMPDTLVEALVPMVGIGSSNNADLFLILMTCKCTHAMLFNFTDSVEKQTGKADG